MRDLSEQITLEEMVEFEAVMNGTNCGAHGATIVCRDCLSIFTLRITIAMRKQVEASLPPWLRQETRGRKPKFLPEKAS
jgi:hypothetical protein